MWSGLGFGTYERSVEANCRRIDMDGAVYCRAGLSGVHRKPRDGLLCSNRAFDPDDLSMPPISSKFFTALLTVVGVLAAPEVAAQAAQADEADEVAPVPPAPARPAAASEVSPTPDAATVKLAQASAKRPRIGLVLSGGGARGAAHVGVLKVLEELRVPIDCIAGTSMGSIVGAAYASGMSLIEMERVILSINSAGLFREQPPRQDQLTRRKQDDLFNFIGPEFGVSMSGLALPKGAVSGVALEAILRDLSSRKRGVRNFDELPIPYRAIATDIENGAMVVLARGELASAMRASMSVPGAIAPAEIDGKILIDGSLVRNLPVDVARQMCADIVIAVNLGSPLLKREQINSVVDVSSQMLNILTEQNVQASLASLKPEDILISPQLGNFSAGDFDNLSKTVPFGETAARKVSERLAILSLPAQDYDLLQYQRTGSNPASGRPVTAIQVEGLSRTNPDVLLAALDTEVGKPIDQTLLDRDLRQIFGRGDFDRVDYRIEDEGDQRILVIRPVEKTSGPSYLRFGLTLSTDYYGDAWFNVNASARKTWINAMGAEWRTDLQMGRVTRLATELYQPVNISHTLFVAPKIDIDRRYIDVFQGDVRQARYSALSTRAGFDFGSYLTKYAELRLGVYRGRLEYTLDTGSSASLPPQASFEQGGWTLNAVYDQIDDLRFPRRGTIGKLNVVGSRESMGATDTYTKWDLNWLLAYSRARHTASLTLRSAGHIGSKELPVYSPIQHGGFLQQSGFQYAQLIGNRLNFGRLLYQYRLADGGLLDGAYLGTSFELGQIGGREVVGQPTGLLKSLGLFVGFDSPLGPMYLGYGQAATGQSNVYFFLGMPLGL